MRKKLVFLFIAILAVSCFNDSKNSENVNPIGLWGKNPWPEIRNKRINTLLPKALKNANVDCWIVICRENNNDPLAEHIGGENAGGTAVFLF